jgi:hypothetical protein
MATDIAVHWQDYPAEVGYLTTELNNLAGKKLGASIDNSSSGARFIDFEVTLAEQGAARDNGAYIAIYILPSVDGVNYCYGGDAQEPPASALVASMPLDAVVTARIVTATHIKTPAGLFKILLKNVTGQNLAASGNTLKYTLYSEAATATPA